MGRKHFISKKRIALGRFFFFVLIALLSVRFSFAGEFELSGFRDYFLSKFGVGPEASVTYAETLLSQIFGAIPGISAGFGTLPSILGQFLKYFNLGLCAIGAYIIGYTTLVGTIYSAVHGKALGQKISSGWVLVRSTIALTLFVPVTQAGLSGLQILVIWFVVQGSIMADVVWNKTMMYVNSAGSYVASIRDQVSTNPNLDSSVGISQKNAMIMNHLISSVSRTDSESVKLNPMKTLFTQNADGIALQAKLIKAELCKEHYRYVNSKANTEEFPRQKPSEDGLWNTYTYPQYHLTTFDKYTTNIQNEITCGVFQVSTKASLYNSTFQQQQRMAKSVAKSIYQQFKVAERKGGECPLLFSSNDISKKSYTKTRTPACYSPCMSAYCPVADELENVSQVAVDLLMTAKTHQDDKEAKSTLTAAYVMGGKNGELDFPAKDMLDRSWLFASVHYLNSTMRQLKNSQAIRDRGKGMSFKGIETVTTPPKLDEVNTRLKKLFKYVDEVELHAQAQNKKKIDLQERMGSDETKKKGERYWMQRTGNLRTHVGGYKGTNYALGESFQKLMPQEGILASVGAFPSFGGDNLVAPKPLTPNEQAKRWSGSCYAFSSLINPFSDHEKCMDSGGSGPSLESPNMLQKAASGVYLAVTNLMLPSRHAYFFDQDVLSYAHYATKTWMDTFVFYPGDLILFPIASLSIFGAKLFAYTSSFMLNSAADITSTSSSIAHTAVSRMLVNNLAPILMTAVGEGLTNWGWDILWHCVPVDIPFAWPGFSAIPWNNMLISKPFCLKFPLPFFFAIPLWLIAGPVIWLIGLGLQLTGVALGVVGASLNMWLIKLTLATRFKYLSIVMAVAGPVFSLAGTLMFYIPFIPLAFYALAVISWFISVIEALVGAPLVLLGMTYPVGHDLWGKANQAFMLVLAVFIRPVTIVIGFVFSILVLSVSMLMLTFMMVPAMNQFLGSWVGDSMSQSLPPLNAVMMIVLMIFYIYVMLNVMNYCFGFIFRLPVYIMKWLGMPQGQVPEEAAMQSIQNSIFSTFGSLAGGMSGITGKAKASQGAAMKGGQGSGGYEEIDRK